MTAWLRFFRIVNLPTVPGDALVGAAACGVFGWRPALVSTAVYLFGLAQNDILGAKTDVDRPIPEGGISMRSAKAAAAACWIAAAILAALTGGAGMPLCAFAYIAAMTVAVTVYNVTKNPLMMGLCRGLGVVFGAAWCAPSTWSAWTVPLALGLVWTAYIAGVTKYSEGESEDPRKRQLVGFLIGALVYLQLLALIFFSLRDPESVACRDALVTGAAMLILLRILKRTFPKVSAS